MDWAAGSLNKPGTPIHFSHSVVQKMWYLVFKPQQFCECLYTRVLNYWDIHFYNKTVFFLTLNAGYSIAWFDTKYSFLSMSSSK